MANQFIRTAAKNAGIPLWRLADLLGVSEATMTRMLRRPLPKEKEAQIIEIIQNNSSHKIVLTAF